MLCDGHVHWIPKKIDFAKLKAYRISNLLREVKEKAIIKVNLIPPITKECCNAKYIETFNKNLIQIVRKYPHIFNGFPLLCNSPSFPEILHSKFVKGVKIHFYLHELKSLSLYINLLKKIEKNGKFIILHAGNRDKKSHEDLLKTKVETIRFITSNFPNIKIIIAHSGRIWPFQSDGIEEFLNAIHQKKIQMNNLYFDTSTIRESSAIKTLLKKVGVEKIIFGSDYPYYKDAHEDTIAEEMNWIKKMGLSKDCLKKIFCDNYRNLFYPNGIWIRKVLLQDFTELFNRLNSLSDIDKKKLALKQKLNLIKEWIRRENLNMWIIEDFNKKSIMGFLRFSDRKEGGVFLEELVIFPEFRNRGMSKKILNLLLLKAEYIETKVFSDNRTMERLLSKYGFEILRTSGKGKVKLWRWQRK